MNDHRDADYDRYDRLGDARALDRLKATPRAPKDAEKRPRRRGRPDYGWGTTRRQS